MLMDDFNAIRMYMERVGKTASTRKSMMEFKSMILAANLVEMTYKGTWLNWDNRWVGQDLILSKKFRGFHNFPFLDFV